MNLNDSYNQVYKKIGYRFKDSELLQLAFTHRSADVVHNERLEFLGDAILGQIITVYIFNKFPDAKEGKLSRLRANLVRGKNLAVIARQLDLPKNLILGQGEIRSGGSNKESMQANVLEAVIGAIYLDSDIKTVNDIVLDWFDSQLSEISLDDIEKDPKSLLQEKLQSLRHELPEYKTVSVEGSDHDQIFHVSCHILALDITTHGRGSSRRVAEQNAARLAILEVKE